jgi:hypothetical protein
MKAKNKKYTWRTCIPQFLLITVLVVQAFAIAGLFIWVRTMHYQIDQVQAHVLGTQIVAATDGLTKAAVADGPTGNVYFPELKLFLPASQDFYQGSRYSLTQTDDKGTQALHIIDDFAYNRARLKVVNVGHSVQEVFAGVPHLQACARGYYVLFDGQTSANIPEQFSKQLKDGRTVHVRLDPDCEENKAVFLPYLKQIESY